jgi:c-di-GMP-binding flagellar brake protein YcgR
MLFLQKKLQRQEKERTNGNYYPQRNAENKTSRSRLFDFANGYVGADEE